MISESSTPNRFAFFLLFFSVLLIYSNNIESFWVFDDIQNVALNPSIQVDTLSPSTFFSQNEQPSQAITSAPAKARYISFFSFAVNWYIGKDNVVGYHIVNNFLHCITAIFLFKLAFELLSSKLSSKLYPRQNAYVIALLGTFFWAFNPIHTQAVTYIVQRMTVLSALFSCMSLYYYVKARKKTLFLERTPLFSLSITFFLLAFLSKENAILLPGSIFLIEFCFFNDLKLSLFKNVKFIFFVFFIFVLFCTVVFSFLYFSETNFSNILAGYKTRYFTLYERVFTEPRVLFFYLSLIFLPLSSRLSLDHDFTLSQGLFSPITTSFSIAAIFLLLLFSFKYHKKYPLLSFAILFFFYNHIIESSIIPLEIIYEHRNYLPSFFLFFPLISVAQSVASRSDLNKSVMAILGVFFLVISGIGTYSRNITWNNPLSLYKDTALKARTKARPLINWGIAEFVLNHNSQKAIQLIDASIGKIEERKNDLKYRALDNKNHVLQKSGYSNEEIIKNFEELISVDFLLIPSYLKYIAYLQRQGQYSKTRSLLKSVSIRIKETKTINKSIFLNYLNLSIRTKLAIGDPEKARHYIIRAIDLNFKNIDTIINLGLYFLKTQKYYLAAKYLNMAIMINPNDINLYFILYEAYRKAHLFQKARNIQKNIYKSFTFEKIRNVINGKGHGPFAFFIDSRLSKNFSNNCF